MAVDELRNSDFCLYKVRVCSTYIRKYRELKQKMFKIEFSIKTVLIQTTSFTATRSYELSEISKNKFEKENL